MRRAGALLPPSWGPDSSTCPHPKASVTPVCLQWGWVATCGTGGGGPGRRRVSLWASQYVYGEGPQKVLVE